MDKTSFLDREAILRLGDAIRELPNQAVEAGFAWCPLAAEIARLEGNLRTDTLGYSSRSASAAGKSISRETWDETVSGLKCPTSVKLMKLTTALDNV